MTPSNQKLRSVQFVHYTCRRTWLQTKHNNARLRSIARKRFKLGVKHRCWEWDEDFFCGEKRLGWKLMECHSKTWAFMSFSWDTIYISILFFNVERSWDQERTRYIILAEFYLTWHPREVVPYQVIRIFWSLGVFQLGLSWRSWDMVLPRMQGSWPISQVGRCISIHFTRAFTDDDCYTLRRHYKSEVEESGRPIQQTCADTLTGRIR